MLARLSKFRPLHGRINFSSTGKKNNAETFANSASAGYMETMYNAWLKDPQSVHISWQAYFSNLKSGSKLPFQTPPTLIPPIPIEGLPSVQVDSSSVSSGDILDTMKVQLMVRAFQVRGHQQANLDPLGINFMGKKDAPELTYQHYGFTEADLDRKFYLGILLIFFHSQKLTF